MIVVNNLITTRARSSDILGCSAAESDTDVLPEVSHMQMHFLFQPSTSLSQMPPPKLEAKLEVQSNEFFNLFKV